MRSKTAKTLLITVVVILFTGTSICAREDSVNRGDGTSASPFLVPRTASSIRIDGKLDEEAWSEALVINLAFEVSPGENIPAPVKTECLLLYNDSHLYVGFRAYDPDPAAIRAHITDRDTAWDDDWVAVVLDTFNDERRDYFLMANPLGVQSDIIEVWTDKSSVEWDAIWDSSGSITDWGYAVEMAIPLDQLRLQRSGGSSQVWGFDAVRRYPRSVRHHIGAFPRDRDNNCYLCQAIKIKGFEGVDSGHNIEVDPTITAVRTDARADFPAGGLERQAQDAEVGVTGRWGITSNMTLSATANPDFNQVEADALQLDINQPFALYYPEKRPFFLEGADYFGTPFPTVYTRAIRDPSWGLKLAGKEGANTVGAYVVRDDITNLIFPGAQGSDSTSIAMANTSSVLRYNRDTWNNSTIGLMATDREGGDYFNRLLALDGRLRFSENDTLTFQLAGSNTRYPEAVARSFGQPLEGFGDSAWLFNFARDTRNYSLSALYEDIGGDFRADLGFMTRVGTKRARLDGAYKWYFDKDDFFNLVRVDGSWERTREQNGALSNRSVTGRLTLDGPWQSEFSLYAVSRKEIYRQIEFNRAWTDITFAFRPSGSVYYDIGFCYGRQIDFEHARPGMQVYFWQDAMLNIGRRLSIGASYNMSQFAYEGERLFLTNTLDSRFVYQLDRRTFIRAVIQYADIRRNTELYAAQVDRKSTDLYTQLLFSYKLNPQTVLFVGYSDGYSGNQNYGMTQSTRTFFVKLGYAWTL